MARIQLTVTFMQYWPRYWSATPLTRLKMTLLDEEDGARWYAPR